MEFKGRWFRIQWCGWIISGADEEKGSNKRGPLPFTKGATLLSPMANRRNHRENKRNLKVTRLGCGQLYQTAGFLT